MTSPTLVLRTECRLPKQSGYCLGDSWLQERNALPLYFFYLSLHYGHGLDCIRNGGSRANVHLVKWDCKLVEFNGEDNHVHLLFQYPPDLELSKLINNLKDLQFFLTTQMLISA